MSREGTSDVKRMRLLVSGRVQGVCYRMDCRDRAEHLGLNGWVRNLPDGRVEVVAEGRDEALGRLLKWCHEGPAFGFVTGIDERYTIATGEFKGFGVRY